VRERERSLEPENYMGIQYQREAQSGGAVGRARELYGDTV